MEDAKLLMGSLHLIYLGLHQKIREILDLQFLLELTHRNDFWKVCCVIKENKQEKNKS
jgi:hypothetical protein